jgi:hypothetical protein
VSFYRLIKPLWAKRLLENNKPNPQFVVDIEGPNTYEGYNFTPEFIREKNDQGYNCYFFPNHPSKDVYAEGVKSLAGKHIDVFNFVFVDMDLKDKVYESKEQFLEFVARFPIKPTMVVNSGNGTHVYWAIKGLTRDEYVFAQLALLKYFRTDESIFTVLQLMRLPGYKNTKRHGDYVPCEILDSHSSGAEYSLSDFPQELFQSLTKDEITRGQKHLDRLDGKLTINAPEFVNIDEVPDTFFDYINDPANKLAFDLWMSPKETWGDRSQADMKLANMLYKANFNKKEALAIISNTQKALSHANRKHYADLTVDKVYTEKLNNKFMTVAQRNRTVDEDRNLGDLVKATWNFDYSVLGNPWRKRELTGLIAGTGIGKTTVTLKWMKDSIENNPDNDDIFVFFTLEMAVGEITDRWNKLVGKESPLAERLYVIGNETETFEPRNIGLQEILEDCNELRKLTGKKIGMMAIDHVGIISKHIDVRKKYTFGIDSEMNAGYGHIRTLSLNSLCSQLKVLCKMLDTHIVVLTQTTKEKGVGDLPIDKDGAYGISNYENIMDRIITIWQPLKLVQHLCKTRFLAWQYVKIRSKHEKDQIQTNEPKLLTFDLKTGDLKITTPEEYQDFVNLYPTTIEMRDAMIKKKGGVGYSIHVNVGQLNGILEKNGLPIKTGDNNAVGQVQPNTHSGTNHQVR